ncbi:type III secretion protein Q [Paraburkholderia sp. BL23I1N1]|nr:type III secretion protein Q [Paraburkholderia sp. BL23I1N1]
MIYPLDEPTTEDEAANDPHATRGHKVTALARMAGDATRERGVAIELSSMPGDIAGEHAVAVEPTSPPGDFERGHSRSANAAATGASIAPIAPITPLRLQAISHAAARVTRAVCDARVAGYLHATLGITEWQAALADAQSFDAAYTDPGVIELTLAPADGMSAVGVGVRVALDLHAYAPLAITAWPDSDALSAKPPADVALRQAVAGVVLEPLFERLIRAGFRDLRVVAVRRGRLGDSTSTRKPTGETTAVSPIVTLSFVLDERRYQVGLSADPACYDVLDRLLRVAPSPASISSPAAATASDTSPSSPDPASETAVDLTVPGSLILGVKRLPVDTLHALESGDVLLRAAFPSLDATLLDASSAPSSPHARPRAVAAWGTPGLTRVCAAVEIDGQSLVIVKEPNMSEELDPASADAGLAIDDPPIRSGSVNSNCRFSSRSTRWHYRSPSCRRSDPVTCSNCPYPWQTRNCGSSRTDKPSAMASW